MFGQKPRYVSEFATFMNDYLKAHPDVAQSQIDGFALLWDKGALNEEEWRSYDQSRVGQKPYPYLTN
ncbi:Protein of unknown function [Formivibrio citricus]|uniref:DUF3460 family protein n=1 Tax=Formivibrio citricus TaxID=83765 RepID=A0A1I5BMU3_9NEIS|nr:DUF3460 family protein [Formivibrio citricus]SFN76033.1 Protein of unknown function [Formivibrio citricus]